MHVYIRIHCHRVVFSVNMSLYIPHLHLLAILFFFFFFFFLYEKFYHGVANEATGSSTEC